MHIGTASRFSFLMLCIVFSPALLCAQAAHCAVRKSPFRISMESGSKIYTARCASCHQADGLGSSSTNFSLSGADVSGDKNRLIAVVIKGQSTQKDVTGKVDQKIMPPNPDIRDQDVADVLTYIRNSFGNKASSVKESEVKSARGKLN
jgi:mono/diheme cytochrome c family protein